MPAHIPPLASGLLIGRKYKSASSAIYAAALGEYLRNQTLGSQWDVCGAILDKTSYYCYAHHLFIGALFFKKRDYLTGLSSF